MSHAENFRQLRASFSKVTRVTLEQSLAGVTFYPSTKSELSGALLRQLESL
jgi:hypothetical protein